MIAQTSKSAMVPASYTFDGLLRMLGNIKMKFGPARCGNNFEL